MTPRSQTNIYKKYLKELEHLSIDSLQTIVDESQEIIDRAQARQSAARDCLVEAKVRVRVEQEKTQIIINQETLARSKAIK